MTFVDDIVFVIFVRIVFVTFVDTLPVASIISSHTITEVHRTDKCTNAPYRKVLTTQLNHLASLAKWLSVRL